MADPSAGWAAPDDQQPPDVRPGSQPPGWGVPPPASPPAAPPETTTPPAAPAPPPGAQPWGAPPAYQWGAPPVPGAPAWGPPPNPNAYGPGWGGGPPPGPPSGPGPGPYASGPYGYGPGWSGGPTAPGRPGIIPLRPLAVGEILDGAFRAIRSNPRTMAGFSAVVIAVLALLSTTPQALLLSTYLNSPLADPERAQDVEASDVAGLIGAGGLTVVVSVLQFVLATTIVSALLIVAVDGAVRGVSLRPGQLWARVRPRAFAVAGLALLVPLALTLLALVAVLPGALVLIFASGTAATVVGVILLLIGVVIAVIGSLALYLGFWAVAAPALLLENLGVFAALSRSYRLVRGNFWRVVGIGLLTAIITGIMRQVFTVPFSIIGALVSGGSGLFGGPTDASFGSALIQLLIGDIGTILAGAVLYPFTAGVAALLYLDLRMRREGLDVDLIRR